MASLKQLKAHNQSGTFRLRLPKEWVEDNSLEHKQELDVIVSSALIVLPQREMSAKEIEELIADIRQLMPARRILRQASESKTHDHIPTTIETLR